MITLYELAGADENRRFSPFVWRARLALAHKELPFKGLPWRFIEKDKIAPSGSEKVPVIDDNGHWLADSWKIACYLEDKYPKAPSLFGSAIGRGEAYFINSWVDGVLQPALFPMYVADIHKHLTEDDKVYFRTAREKLLGRSLEDVQAGRETCQGAFEKTLTPLRHTLKNQPFICGDAPAYADYIIFSSFQWIRCISDYKCLQPGDPVYDWRGRMLDLFDGMAGKAVGYPV
jgi:glutathione S-transferase